MLNTLQHETTPSLINSKKKVRVASHSLNFVDLNNHRLYTNLLSRANQEMPPSLAKVRNDVGVIGKFQSLLFGVELADGSNWTNVRSSILPKKSDSGHSSEL
jgi:hypothetical protein